MCRLLATYIKEIFYDTTKTLITIKQLIVVNLEIFVCFAIESVLSMF